MAGAELLAADPTAAAATVTRAGILAIEAAIARMPQLELRHVDHFAPGLYARELRIPAGCVLTGKIHRQAHLNVVSKGRISVATEDGVKVLQAGDHLISPPGVKRVGIAHVDTVWTTFHATELTDVDEIERVFIAPSFAALEEPSTWPDLVLP